MELETLRIKKRFWLWALTILLVKCSVIFCLIPNSFARESFEFNLGQKINVLSDKAFRKTRENEFEAVGNVVITHMKNSIYGEKARLNFNSGETEVEGNVRFISPIFTLYGTKLKYNFLTKEIDLSNARILSESFSVVGKSIIQKSPTELQALEAEYTTCKDCPESWSIFGRNIDITIGKYVKIKHAFIKANGVITMYIPYIVFPIKQGRETGILFPTINYKTDEGLRYQQPFFWAINNYSDLTLSPSIFGSRGYGGEFQYRQNFSEKTWLQVNSLFLNDKIYEPYKSTKEQNANAKFRHVSDLEFHSIYKQNLNSHFYYNKSSDLDTKRDFTFFTNDRVLGTEYGGGGFIDYRFPLLNLSLEGYFNQNMLVADPNKFDDEYVQLLPRLTLSSVPFNLIHSDLPLLRNISLGIQSDYSIFKQNKPISSTYIRNAQRLNINPYLEWQLGNLGPVFFTHTLKWDYQNYYFPRESDKNFSKKGFVYETEAKFELDRVFGIAYLEPVPTIIDNGNQQKNDKMLGDLPTIAVKNQEETQYRQVNAYKHTQEFKLKHFYLSDQAYKGNSNFYAQIQNEAGQFDYLDALRAKEKSLSTATVSDSLPLNNTLEIQWNNSLIRKLSKKFNPLVDGKYLKDNFEYKNISYFDISQGFDFNVKSENFVDRLTRLYLNSGLNFDNSSLIFQEFYFHKTGEHKLSSEFNYNFSQSKIGGKFTYNSFNSSTIAVTKLIGLNLEWYLNDLFKFKTAIEYDIASKFYNNSFYSMTYSPLNNCWKIELNYAKDQIEKRVGFIFYINYNENNFASINVH